MQPARAVALAGALATQTLFAWLLLAGLGTPLLWYDEGETAMVGRRVLEYGYPKVHGPRNVVYGVQHAPEVGIDESLDAYLGSPWGQYYFAAPAVAWSDGADGLEERTRRVRLPFALAGWAGTLLFLVAGAALFPKGGISRRGFALAFGACLCVSVSLQLHLREARYYPLVVGVLGGLAWLEVRHRVRGDLAALPHGLLVAPLCWLLFNLFYPAFGAVVATAALAVTLRALRRGGSLGARFREAVRAVWPYAAAVVASLPLAHFYALPATLGAFFETYRGGPDVFAARLSDALFFLLRFEFLGPVLIGIAALGAARAGRRGAEPSGLGARLVTCDVLTLLVGTWVLLVARTPFFYERYVVPLSPAVSGLLCLQVRCLLDLRAAAPRRALAGAVLLVGAAVLSTGLRAPELQGRFAELREPYRGPLDYAIPDLASRYAKPEDLVIATNYEGLSYMFYLHSTVTLDFYAPDFKRDLQMQPDVIVPRPWPAHRSGLIYLAHRASYRIRELPVPNLRANNVPMLSSRNQAGMVHRFRSPKLAPGEQGLFLLERVERDEE